MLPLGSPNVKPKLEPVNIKSIMLYGPHGSGKTMMVEAIANELGALLINISPARLGEWVKQHTGKPKDLPYEIMQMIYEVSTEDPNHNWENPHGGHPNPNAPVVIYMDQCEQYFLAPKKGKKGGGDDNPPPAGLTAKQWGDFVKLFVKALQEYKDKAFKPIDRVIFIGTCSNVQAIDDKAKKTLKKFFDKYLYMPIPDYPSRLMLWRSFVQQQLQLGSGTDFKDVPDDFDLSTLSRISEGFSAGAYLLPFFVFLVFSCAVSDGSLSPFPTRQPGAISRCVRKTLTKRRVDRLDRRPLKESEFLSSLALEASRGQMTWKQDNEAYKKFTSDISGLTDRRKAIQEMNNPDEGGDDKKGKGKKK